MSKIEDLLKTMCPDGVKAYALNEVCTFQNGFSFKSGLFKSNGEKILRITNINDGKIIEDNCVYFDLNDYKENLEPYKVFKGDIVVAMSGATTGKIGCNYSDKIFYLNQRVGLFRPNEEKLNKRYLYHWLLSKSNEIYNISSGTGAQPNLSSIKMMDFKIAVPPLEVQCEIVHILDDFTLLSAELSAELKAREKQYEYYKDKLFDFEDKIKIPLSEICTMERGGNFQKKHFTEEGVPAIHYGKIYTYYGLYTDKTLNFIDEEIAKKQKFANNNDIVMAVTSENVEDVCKCVVWEGKEPVAVSGHSVIIRHNQNARFLAYYFTTSHFQRQKERYCIGTKVIEMKPDNLAKILVPIPSIEEQNRIVSILDKFYSITNDISEGLPAEIELRQKQYEYYRDELLTFKEISNG